MRVRGGIERTPMRFSFIRFCSLADMTNESILGCTVFQKVLLGFVKADTISSARHKWVCELKFIILPKAKRTDGIAARWLIKNQVTTYGTWIKRLFDIAQVSEDDFRCQGRWLQRRFVVMNKPSLRFYEVKAFARPPVKAADAATNPPAAGANSRRKARIRRNAR